MGSLCPEQESGALPPSLCQGFRGATDEEQRRCREGGSSSPPGHFLNCLGSGCHHRPRSAGAGGEKTTEFLYPFYTQD